MYPHLKICNREGVPNYNESRFFCKSSTIQYFRANNIILEPSSSLYCDVTSTSPSPVLKEAMVKVN